MSWAYSCALKVESVLDLLGLYMRQSETVTNVLELESVGLF
jgi:hypothetical protein